MKLHLALIAAVLFVGSASAQLFGMIDDRRCQQYGFTPAVKLCAVPHDAGCGAAEEEQMRQLNNRQRARTFGYDSAPPQQPQQPAIRRTWAAGSFPHIATEGRLS